MEQKPINSWQNKIEVKKGNIGEEIARKHMEGLGYIVYEPVTDGAHPFDKLIAAPDKTEIFILDVKTKPFRKYYPDTGIDIKAYNTYKSIINKYNIDVFLFFVDEYNHVIFGNTLTKLDIPYADYPKEIKGIRYWHVKSMEYIGSVSQEESNIIKSYYTGKYY